MAAFKSPRTPRVHLHTVALALIVLVRPSVAYNYFSFEYNITDISPLLNWGIPRIHPPWVTDFSNMSTGSAAPFTPWTSPTNYSGPVGWGDSGHSAQPSQDPASEPPRLVLLTEATSVRILGSRQPDTKGTAVEIKSSVDKPSFDTGPDEEEPAPTGGALLSLEGMPWGMRNIVMIAVDPARTYTVGGATIRTQLLSNASSWEQVPVSYETFVVHEDRNPRFIVADGQSSRWRPENRRTAVNDGPSIVTELVAGNSSTITIPIPPGTTFVFVNGTVGPDRGAALVKWNPQPPYFPSEGWWFNATCEWSAPAMLYSKFLDPDKEYNLTIQTLSSELHNVTNIGLHMLTYYAAWPNEASTSQGAAAGTTETKSHTGKIIGGVVGGVLSALALAAILTFFLRWRRRAKAAAADTQHDPAYRTSPYMQEVDGGSIHSSSSSRNLRALPPSYNPQWSSRVRPEGSLGASSSTDGLTPLSAPPLSPGVAGATSGFFKQAQATPPGKATATAMAMADYKHPYVTGTFERLGGGESSMGLGAGPPPEDHRSPPAQPAPANNGPPLSPVRTRRPLPTPPIAPTVDKGVHSSGSG